MGRRPSRRTPPTWLSHALTRTFGIIQQRKNASMTVGTDFVLNALAEEGLTHLFMVPGGLVDPFLPALARVPRLRPIVAAHEGGAAYMADGYARASGRFGAVLGIGGPGLTNMATAVAAAKTDGSPVLVLSGEIPVDMEGLGEFQDASQTTLDDTAVIKPITRLSETVVSPRSLDHALRRALTVMWSQPQGPVHLSLTHDALVGTVSADYAPVSTYFKAVHPLSMGVAIAAIACLNCGHKVAFLAGAGVEHDDAASLLKAVAERWSIPVATTLRAKGVFPEDHELSLGVFGYAGTRHATAAILTDPPDVLIVLGSGFNERDTMHWTLRGRTAGKTFVIHVNTDMETLTTHGTQSCPVLGSCGAFLQLMQGRAEAIVESLAADVAARRAWLAKIKAGERLYDVENCTRSARPIHPAAAIAALRKACPRDGVVLIDSGAHRAFAGHYWEAYEPRTYISATNLGPMGWAIPAAVGVQIAKPDRRVAVITGDGCMQMHGMEIQTAARYGLPIIYLVLNNGALGNVWLRAHQYGPLPAEMTSIPDHDWAGFARALGAEGYTVSDPADLAKTFELALASGKTALIDVKADKDCPTPVYDFAAGARAWSFHE
jgi:acetolactate synthase I/II/III large subunit